jgi:LAS superfamily LD-carboxypeptidase LdcB
MAKTLTAAQLTGRDESHLVALPCGQRLQREAADAFDHLRRDALDAGFELAVASAFRSFDRQLAIWNGKACGERAVHDDAGHALDMSCLAPAEQVCAILRFSALPGASRHHWGTDLDVFDAAALPAGYRVQLSPQEVAPGGMFDALHNWLDERIATGGAHGFYRPYGEDHGGVAPERWHLSYAPLADACAGQLDASVLRRCWDESADELLLRREVESRLPAILQRYVFGTAVG